jgi:hypothetical protein
LSVVFAALPASSPRMAVRFRPKADGRIPSIDDTACPQTGRYGLGWPAFDIIITLTRHSLNALNFPCILIDRLAHRWDGIAGNKGVPMRHVLGVVFLFVVGSVQAATVWTGPDVVFTKDYGADFTLAANQDFLTSNVILTRGDRGLLCNVAAGDACLPGLYSNPTGTEWAVGDLADYATLSYSDFNSTMSSAPPFNFEGTTMVLHLITDDIYLSLTGLFWQPGNSFECLELLACGAVSYSRSSAVPIPAAVWLFGSGLGLLGWFRRRQTA